MPQPIARAASDAKTSVTRAKRQARATGRMWPSPRVQASSNVANRIPANSSSRLGAVYRTRARPTATARTVNGKASTRLHTVPLDAPAGAAAGVEAGAEDRASGVMGLAFLRTVVSVDGWRSSHP